MGAAKRNGRFITLEGGEGVGKSTLARALGEALRGRGCEVVLTREPGGSPGADEIRALLVRGEGGRWSPLEEALLFATARASHLRHTIRPALEAGAVVICDRFTDSTRAYQAAAGGLSLEALGALNALIQAPAPDLTFILDLDPELGLARSQSGGKGEDRFERQGAEFHGRVRAEFLAIAAREPGRCHLLDAAQPPANVAAQALALIETRL
jgi:dTMP kinase